ncbi:hypothetical protein [Amycolatopsis sp. CA-128772]|uniref:hypothetical protein n=1 Tax=Amycolatopsis sp. CA-128772 TaxID=2073159 RepID=UPI001E5CA5A2|nr:hypothetical protein [Amycolatopsis sp. CA-128772]
MSRRRGNAPSTAASRRRGSLSHSRNRSTALSLGSLTSSACPGRASASIATSTGSRPVSPSTTSTTLRSVTPFAASSSIASASVNTGSAMFARMPR